MSIIEAEIVDVPRYSSLHAQMRVAERFKVNLDERDFDRMVMLIERDDVRTLRISSRPQANGCLRYAVLHRDRVFPVVFNPQTHQIVTVLPPCVLAPYGDRLERVRAEIG